jgi:hypothetical protein
MAVLMRMILLRATPPTMLKLPLIYQPPPVAGPILLNEPLLKLDRRVFLPRDPEKCRIITIAAA